MITRKPNPHKNYIKKKTDKFNNFRNYGVRRLIPINGFGHGTAKIG
jgi:hypothetical protein